MTIGSLRPNALVVEERAPIKGHIELNGSKSGNPFVVALIPNPFILYIRYIHSLPPTSIRAILDEGVEIITIGIGLCEKLALNQTTARRVKRTTIF